MKPSTNKFVYEHIIIFESICLQVKPKFRLQHDSSIYIYKTEAFDLSTIFHISIT